MACNCTYFKLADGVLVCDACGKPAKNSKQEFTDKTLADVEFKKEIKPEAKASRRK